MLLQNRFVQETPTTGYAPSRHWKCFKMKQYTQFQNNINKFIFNHGY